MVFPERESGRNLAHTLDNKEVLNYIPLAKGYSLVKTPVPWSWRGKTLGELEIPKKWQVHVAAIQRTDGTFLPAPQPDVTFRPGDVLFTLGAIEKNETVIALE